MLFRTSNISKIDEPVTFLLYKLEYYFFLNDVDIQLILEFIPKTEKIAGF